MFALAAAGRFVVEVDGPAAGEDDVRDIGEARVSRLELDATDDCECE